MPDQTFKKEERLKSKKIIARLFTEGRSFTVYPVRVVWLPITPSDEKAAVRFAISVPRKKFPKAIDRNKLKRRLREAYRLHKHLLYEGCAANDASPQFVLIMIYIAKEQLPYNSIEKSVVKIIRRLITELNKT